MAVDKAGSDSTVRVVAHALSANKPDRAASTRVTPTAAKRAIKPTRRKLRKQRRKLPNLETQLTANRVALVQLQQQLGYHFTHLELLQQALRHRSLAEPNNERLEFLGDALVGLIAAEQLYRLKPTAKEGELSRCRISLVSGESLAVLAERFGIEQQLQFMPQDMQRCDLTTRHRMLLADAMEAIAGAIFLDGGWDMARAVVASWFQPAIQQVEQLDIKDNKTKLQEWLQNHHLTLPEYRLVGASGLEHERQFTIECRLQLPASYGRQCTAFTGIGYSKRTAEQVAAQAALVFVNDVKNVKSAKNNADQINDRAE